MVQQWCWRLEESKTVQATAGAPDEEDVGSRSEANLPNDSLVEGLAKDLVKSPDESKGFGPTGIGENVE